MTCPVSSMNYQDIIDYFEQKGVTDDTVLYNSGAFLDIYRYNVQDDTLEFSHTRSVPTKSLYMFAPIAYQTFGEFKAAFEDLDYLQQNVKLYILTPADTSLETAFEPITKSILNSWLIDTEDFSVVQLNDLTRPKNAVYFEASLYVPGTYFNSLSFEGKLRYLNRLINVSSYLDITNGQTIQLDTFINVKPGDK